MTFIDEEKEMNQMSQHQIHNWNKPEKILRRQDSQNFLSKSLEFGSTKKL